MRSVASSASPPTATASGPRWRRPSASPPPATRTSSYAQASAAAQEAPVTDRAVADIVLTQGLLTQADHDDILRPEALVPSGSCGSR
ncbi:hypothetical protein [Streptomyces sp. NPDC091212]|uniref:hypothetical protein n=1 Tax=Streptomyces sp. NPDC091212 TaxID=3155191 RepID=UPI00342C27C6